MKKIKILFLLFVGVSLTFASCKKDTVEDTPPVVVTGSYIDKETYDDGSYTKFTYNAAHQVTLAQDYDNMGVLQDGSANFTYASGFLVKFESISGGSADMKLEFTNNASGMPVKADVFSDDGAGLIQVGYFEYTYSGNQLTQMSMFFEVMGQTLEVSKSEFIYSGDNVSMIKLYEMGGTLALEYAGSEIYEYDTKVNPYLNIGLNFFMGEINFMNKNNYTKMTSKDASGAVMNDQSENVTYEYNSANQPSKRTINSFDNSYTDMTILSYVNM